MFPMMKFSATKANVKEDRVKKGVVGNTQLEELHAECYERLMEAITNLADEFKLKISSILPTGVSNIYSNSTERMTCL